jgi:uncharacterized protein (TIGR04255 family)
MPTKLKIDLAKRFPHLARAPIVEAAMQFRARAEVAWEEARVLEILKPKLPDYPTVQSGRAIMHQLKLVSPGKPAEQTVQDLGWTGLRFISADGRHIAQVDRNGLLFSRLQPYDRWEQFHTEAFRMWRLYEELARPTEIQVLGLRFINQIPLPAGTSELEDYLEISPQPPKHLELPFASFFHNDMLLVPNHPYVVVINRTVQPMQSTGPESFALIVDIDVSTTQPTLAQGADLERQLLEMRWLKNKVFFGTITRKVIKHFQ